MFIKLTNQEQTNLLMVLAAIFCLWVVWKLVNHRHDKITGEVMNSGKLRRLLPGHPHEGMTAETAESLKTVIDDMVNDEDGGGGDEEGAEDEDGGGGEDEEGGGGEEDGDAPPPPPPSDGGGSGPDPFEDEDEDKEGFGDYYEGFQKEDDFELYEGQENEDKKHDSCELFYGLKKCSSIDHMEFDSGDDKSAMMKHCKKCKK